MSFRYPPADIMWRMEPECAGEFLEAVKPDPGVMRWRWADGGWAGPAMEGKPL